MVPLVVAVPREQRQEADAVGGTVAVMTGADPELTPAAAAGLARVLAGRHATPAEPVPGQGVTAFAAAVHRDDWSLRSALVRLAQPEPVLAGALLEVVRRCEGALSPRVRDLERHTVLCQPSLSPSSIELV